MTNNLKSFAARVQAAGRQVPPAGRFGSKAFIHAVWAIGRFDESLAEFKAMLVEANRLRLVDLSRADMPEALDPYNVQRSEIRHLGAVFNFIRVD